jgi:hypothetical protein
METLGKSKATFEMIDGEARSPRTREEFSQIAPPLK